MRQTWGLANAFVVGYSGNLGRAHEIATLVEAIAHIEQLPPGDKPQTSRQIRWLFVGGGAAHTELKKQVAARGLSSVCFQPYQPRDRLAESLAVADVHLVSLRAAMEGLIVPSKLYGVMAAARPTIFIGAKDGEVARVLARNTCGRQVDEGDGRGLAEAVLALASNPAECDRMGANARRAFETNYDKTVAVAKWQTLLGDLGAGD